MRMTEKVKVTGITQGKSLVMRIHDTPPPLGKPMPRLIR